MRWRGLPKLPRVTGKELKRALERAGFMPLRTRGDHVFMRNPQTNCCTTVPVGNRTLAVWLVASILDEARLTAEGLRELRR